MIINPLTGKSIKASGKLAKQLYQMHKEKRIKLKRQDIQTMKECMVNKQHGGGTCQAEYLNNDVMTNIASRLDFITKTRLAATSKNYVKIFKDANVKEKNIIEIGSLEERINMLKSVRFNCYTLGDFQHNTGLGTLVKQCATFEDDGLFQEYCDLFVTYPIPDGGRRLPDINAVVWKDNASFKTRCENFWILGAISACIDDPHELITIYDDIYDKYETNRGQTGYNTPLASIIENIPSQIINTSGTLLETRNNTELSDIEKEEKYDKISKTTLAGLNLETIIKYLQLFTLHNMQKHGMY